jgi:hypothetical protein
MLRIAIGLALAVVSYALSAFFWPLWKRSRLVGRLVRDADFLRASITPAKLAEPPESVSIYAERHSHGYAVNIFGVVGSDEKALTRLKIRVGVPLLLALVASYFLGIPYLLLNLAVTALVAAFPLGQRGRASAAEQVLTLAVILHRWHGEDPAECADFIGGAWTLRPLYDAVLRVGGEDAV